MIASLMRHSQVIKAPLEIYEDVFGYRKFRRRDPGFFSHFFWGGGKEQGRVSSGEGEGMNPSASPQGRGDQVICASSSR